VERIPRRFAPRRSKEIKRVDRVSVYFRVAEQPASHSPMTEGDQNLFRTSPDAGRGEASLSVGGYQRLDALVGNQLMGVSEAGPDVFGFEARAAFEDRCRRVPV
jgi:hypothetical protein